MKWPENKKNNYLIIVLALIITLVLVVIISYNAYARYNNQQPFNIHTSYDVAEYNFNVGVNQADNFIQTINLLDTLDNDSNYLTNTITPGRSGHFVLNMNSTGSEVAVKYIITIQRTNIPNNLKFYTDENFTNELNQITGNILLDGQRIVPVTIYWKWLNIDNEQSNINDSLYQNSQMSFKVNVLSEQLLEGDNN